MAEPTGYFKVVSNGKSMDTKVYWPNGDAMGLVQELTIQIRADQVYADITRLKLSGVEVRTVPIAAHMDIAIPEDQVTITEVPLDSKKEDSA